jgi:hypothetical protein
VVRLGFRAAGCRRLPPKLDGKEGARVPIAQQPTLLDSSSRVVACA